MWPKTMGGFAAAAPVAPGVGVGAPGVAAAPPPALVPLAEVAAAPALPAPVAALVVGPPAPRSRSTPVERVLTRQRPAERTSRSLAGPDVGRQSRIVGSDVERPAVRDRDGAAGAGVARPLPADPGPHEGRHRRERVGLQ